MKNSWLICCVNNLSLFLYLVYGEFDCFPVFWNLAMTGTRLTITLASIIYPLSSKYFFLKNLIRNHPSRKLGNVTLILRMHKNTCVGYPSKMLIGSFAQGNIKHRAVFVTDLARHWCGQPLVSVLLHSQPATWASHTHFLFLLTSQPTACRIGTSSVCKIIRVCYLGENGD